MIPAVKGSAELIRLCSDRRPRIVPAAEIQIDIKSDKLTLKRVSAVDLIGKGLELFIRGYDKIRHSCLPCKHRVPAVKPVAVIGKRGTECCGCKACH